MSARRASRRGRGPTSSSFASAPTVRGSRSRVSRGRRLELEVTLQQAGKRAKVNGAPLRSVEQLRSAVSTLVFTPDRLAVVKGGPAARRAYFDRTLGRLQPGRAALPVEYAAAVGQRNAALRRVQVGASTREAVAPWTEQVVALGAQLVVYRQEALAVLAPAFAERAGELGLPDAALAYAASRRRSAAWRRGSSATSSAASPVSARTWTTSRSARAARPAQLRLAGRAAPGRALAAARRGRGDRGAAGHRRSSCSTTSSRSSTRRGGGPGGADRPGRPGRRHGDGRRRAPARAGAAARSHPGVSVR